MEKEMKLDRLKSYVALWWHQRKENWRSFMLVQNDSEMSNNNIQGGIFPSSMSSLGGAVAGLLTRDVEPSPSWFPGKEEAVRKDVGSDNTTKVMVWLRRGLPINHPLTNEGETVLHYAMSRNAWNVIKLLLENGADVNAADVNGNTALHKASRRDDSDLIKMLLEAGADPLRRNHRNERPLDVWRSVGGVGIGRAMRQMEEKRTGVFLTKERLAQATIEAERQALGTDCPTVNMAASETMSKPNVQTSARL